jgi:5-hydroxyisourate hydrolase-like protein (transthyretin family)
MNTLLLSLLFLVQGIPVQQSGTVTGILRNADGKPAAGVRVSAVPQTDAIETTAAGLTLSSIAETDANGRYKLENVPPGRYYVAAGRLDLPTYYPGTQSMVAGRSILVSAGLTVPDIDFALNANSAGRSESSFSFQSGGVILLDLSLDVRVEGGGKLPILNGGKRITVQLTPVTATTQPLSASINATNISIPPPIADYRGSVDSLPDGYSVKSIKSDSTELPDRILRITAVALANGNITFASSTAYTYNLLLTASSAGTPIPAAPTKKLVITLDSASTNATRSAGVHVTGSLPPNTIRGLYLDGTPGIVFSDATFEFRNVPAGRHVITTTDNPPGTGALGAYVAVGSSNLSGVEVVKTPVLPSNMRTISTGLPAGSRAPGALPLAAMRGHVVDSETGNPVTRGTVYVVGDSWASAELGADGKFEFEKLLPGTYEIEIQGIGYPTLRRPVVMEEQDVDLELKAG